MGDSDRDYDETESEEIEKHRNVKILMRLHQLVQQALNTSSGKGGDETTLIIHII